MFKSSSHESQHNSAVRSALRIVYTTMQSITIPVFTIGVFIVLLGGTLLAKWYLFGSALGAGATLGALRMFHRS